MRFSLFVALVLILASGATGAESPYLYGIHDTDPAPTEYLSHIKQGSVTGGWITSTVAVGYNPGDTSGVDFTSFANQGHTVVCRINNGYSDVGTIPLPEYYDEFAQRCANFVQNSPGCSIWVIGNETNLASEWPPSGGHKPYVSPQSYADCFRQVYNAIKAVRPNHKVVSQALAPFGGPYGPGTFDRWTHDGVPLSWVDYMNEMLAAIRNSGGLDGIALHINSRGYAYSDIHSTAQIPVAGKNLYWSFYVYKDWINYGIPADLYHLPLYATECNGVYYWNGGHPENPSSHYEPGWMQEIYAEINRWNQSAVATGKPVFRCINMYRWCNGCDGWNIDGSPYEGQILSDLDASVAQALKWPEPGVVVDNSDAGFSVVSGTWNTGASAADKYGADYRFSDTGTGADVARWTPALAQTGNYDVYAYYPAGSNRANNAPFTIHHRAGSNTVLVNQSVNGGQWWPLTTAGLPFDAGTSGSVTLSDQAQAGKVVVADALKWVYRSPIAAPGAINGYVRNRDGLAVAGAQVATSDGLYSALTNGSGYYLIADVVPGAYELKASKIAYCYQTASVSVASGGSTAKDFALTRIGDNLLANGNFEGGFQGSGAAVGWTPWTSGWSNPITFADSTSPVHAGSHAQRWGRADRLRVHGGICQSAGGVTPGRQYVVDGWVRFQATDPGAWIEVGYDLTGQALNGEAATVQYTKLESGGQNTWLHYGATVSATGNAISVFLKFGQYNEGGSGPNWAYADDISISEAPTPPVMQHVLDDGVYQTAASIHGSWLASDPESGVIQYMWAVSSTPLETGIVTGGAWTSVGTATQGARSLYMANGQVYYILVKARNPHNQWSSVMASDGIRMAAGPYTLSSAKKQPDGKWVEVPNLVCARAPVADILPVREIGNAVGIKVTKGSGSIPAGIVPGTRLTVAGRLATVAGSREITDVCLLPAEAVGAPKAPFMLSREVGGGDFFYAAGPPIQGQQGSPWGIGANNVGLMASVIGRVSGHGTGKFFLDDGSNLPGGLPVAYLPGVTRPDVGRLVKVTGLVEANGLLVLSQGDIAVVP